MRSARTGAAPHPPTHPDRSFDMTNLFEIKALWFYLMVAGLISSGFGAGIAASPYVLDVRSLINESVEQGRMEAMRECEAMRESANTWRSAAPRNTPGKEF